MKKLWLVLVILCGKAFAIDVGTFGPVYEVVEPDVLDWIYNTRLPELERNGEIKKLQQKLQNKAQKSVERPKGVVLPAATKHKIRRKNLMVKLNQDLYDADGALLLAQGTKVDPFQYLPESQKTLLFIDGDSNTQVNWAVDEYQKNHEAHIVLTQGKPIELSNKKKVPIYFDQAHALTRHFRIDKLPTKLYRQGHILYIEEIVLELTDRGKR